MQVNSIEPLFNRESLPSDKSQALSPAQAITVFDWLAGMKDIAYQYATDGCYARAHIMCQRLMEEGFKPQKAWAFEEDGEYYRVKLQDGTTQRFGFHVAPTLAVQNPDGSVEDMIFDPAFFDGPVTEAEWGGIVTNGWPPETQVQPFGVPPRGYLNDYIPKQKIAEPDHDARIVMEKHFAEQPRPAVTFTSTLRTTAAMGEPKKTAIFEKYENK